MTKRFFLGEMHLLTSSHLALPPDKHSVLRAAPKERGQAWNSTGRRHRALADGASWPRSGGLGVGQPWLWWKYSVHGPQPRETLRVLSVGS